MRRVRRMPRWSRSIWRNWAFVLSIWLVIAGIGWVQVGSRYVNNRPCLMSLLRLLRARTSLSWVYSHHPSSLRVFSSKKSFQRTPVLVGTDPFLSIFSALHMQDCCPRAYKPCEASSLGRVVVAWRIRQYAWKVQRCTRVVGQILLQAFANPLPPSVTTRAGGAIRLMSASQAREFSLLAAYQPSTQSGV